ncbi:hypothetical protein QCA50_014402 [Cerrena zonata]|uniref:Enoyl reductase (ER) domain-containing protein n=1 Tax=Cerrena zonata TaxID=2478898 RepID=A0AAW0FZ76_9APHY
MSIPTTHKALVIQQKGGDPAIETVKTYTPKPDEVLVRIEAAGVNPADWKVRDFGLVVGNYPLVLGLDAAGEVVATGEEVTSLAIGDRVIYSGWLQSLSLGTFQQYGTVPAEFASKIPPSLSFDEAATIPLAISTAGVGLYGPVERGGGTGLTPPWLNEGRKKYSGQPVVVFGGSGSVGKYTIQLAELSGFSPIVTTASPQNFELVKSLGATHVVDRHLPPREIEKAINAIIPGPIKFIYDTVSLSATQNTAYDLLSSGGILVVYLSSKVDEKKTTPDKKIIASHGTGYAVQNKDVCISLYTHLTDLIDSGDIKPNVVEILPKGLSGIPDAMERVKRDEVSGKRLIARPQETS